MIVILLLILWGSAAFSQDHEQDQDQEHEVLSASLPFACYDP
jgi:hypothetical protein